MRPLNDLRCTSHEEMIFRLNHSVTLTPDQIASLCIDPQTARSSVYPGIQFSWTIDYINASGTFVTGEPYKYPAETFTMRCKLFATASQHPDTQMSECEDPRNVG